jgi:hypothetical protein
MAEDPEPDQAPARPTWARRVRTRITEAGSAARRRMERRPGRGKAATVADAAAGGTSSADDAERVRAELARADAAARSTVNRTRLVIAIVGVAAQVAMVLIAWRLRARRRQRRR